MAKRLLGTRTLRDGSRTYHIDGFENGQGQAIRLTEVVPGRDRASIIISKEFFDALMDSLDDVADESFDPSAEDTPDDHGN